MFMPALELITQQNLEGQSTEAVLLLAQNLTEADMMRAGQELPLDTVRPVRLWDALQQYAAPFLSAAVMMQASERRALT